MVDPSLFAGVQRLIDPDAATVLAPWGITVRFVVAADPMPNTYLVKQVHGARIVAAGPESRRESADGLWLRGSGAIAVRTADCLPILLAAPQHGLQLALHAGWRSLAADIVGAAALLWQQQGIAAADIFAVLGPTLCARHFEIGPEVVAAFAQPQLRFSAAERCWFTTAGRGDRSHMDLSAAALVQLLTLGVPAAQISQLDSCTFCHPERWPSWRRDGTLLRHIWSLVKTP